MDDYTGLLNTYVSLETVVGILQVREEFGRRWAVGPKKALSYFKVLRFRPSNKSSIFMLHDKTVTVFSVVAS